MAAPAYMSIRNDRSAGCSAGTVSTSTEPPMAANDRALSGCVIFSAPTASATSHAPDATACPAMWNAPDADAHAFSPLNIRIPARPAWPRGPRLRGGGRASPLRGPADPAQHRVVVRAHQLEPVVHAGVDRLLAHLAHVQARRLQRVQVELERPWLQEHAVAVRAVRRHPVLL